jgi:Icc-related predicted phosphoesterase
LDIPLLYVHGNHALADEGENLNKDNSNGTVDLHCRVSRFKGYTFAGIEGCLRYKDGKYLYSQFDMWLNVFRLVPPLLVNRVTTSRYLNVFVSHAPPFGIQDQSDIPHQGIKAFRWLLTHFQPDYHLHGHIHVYRPDMVTETTFGRTRVINTYGYRQIAL